MSKEQRHEKAEQFRREIALPNMRAAAIRDIVVKDVYDETDTLRIRILLQKPDYKYASWNPSPSRHMS